MSAIQHEVNIMPRVTRLRVALITVLAVGIVAGITGAYRARRGFGTGFGLWQRLPTDPYRGRWVDDSANSSASFFSGGRVQIRLFDLLNASELAPDEIIETPVNTGSTFPDGQGPKYAMTNWKVNGKPATLTRGCAYHFILERTELVKMVVRFDETPKRRMWGTRFIDARYSIGDQGQANVYVVATVGAQEMDLNIAAATVQRPGLLKLAREGIGSSFFTLERVFRKVGPTK